LIKSHFIVNKTTYSWTSGSKISSHFERLKEYLRKSRPQTFLEVYNVSVPGATAKNLPKQVGKIVAKMKTGKFRALKYVTLMIGANDSCDDTPDDEFESSLLKTFEKLAEINQNEPIYVMVAGAPRIADVGM